MSSALDRLQQFRQRLYQTFCQRADVAMDLIDALAQSDQVESPVAVSQVPSFRRRFASIYDALHFSQQDEPALRRLLYESVPPDSQTLAGYEVYAVDVTPQPHPAAGTLADRTWVCVAEDAPAVAGHQYSLLVRLVRRGTSWVAPLSVQRVASTTNADAVAAAQVQALDQQSAQPKVVVADSGYGNQHFLRIFLRLQTSCALVRLRGNLVLYEAGSVRQARGRKRVHGDRFPLAAPRRTPDREETLARPGGTVSIQAWQNLHLQPLAALPGMVLRVQGLRADGSLRHRRPLWLFWTGPTSVSLADLYQMYAWRFTIEIVFTQMTKGRVLASWGRRNDVADFHLGVVNDDPVDQQLYQLSALGEIELIECGLHAPAEIFNAGSELGGVQLLLGLRLQLTQLLHQAVLRLGDFLALALELVAADHLGQVDLEQAGLLALQLRQCGPQGALAILQCLGEPFTGLGTYQFMRNESRISQ